MNVAGLALTDAVHLCATRWAGSFGGRLAVLHRYLLRVLHLPLGPALQTIRFHTVFLPFLSRCAAVALPRGLGAVLRP